MKESFEQELQESKKKAASEVEALSKKGEAERDEMARKNAEEAALRAEADKKAKYDYFPLFPYILSYPIPFPFFFLLVHSFHSPLPTSVSPHFPPSSPFFSFSLLTRVFRQLDSEVRELTTKLANATKALAREEELRAKLAADLKNANESMENMMSSKEKQFSSELESLRCAKFLSHFILTLLSFSPSRFLLAHPQNLAFSFPFRFSFAYFFAALHFCRTFTLLFPFP